MLRKIKATIQNNELIRQNTSVLIGLSGGADSVALTHALYRLKDEFNLKLYTAHLNHGIRGEEADKDENFAISFSNSLGIECFAKKIDIKNLSKGSSEELIGRNERYVFFNEICKEYSIDYIATAHNKNDNVETIVMNLVRGTALSGLGGIPYKRDNIIRPLLDVERKEIESYCKSNSLDFVTDSTNLTEDYTRNKIRLSLFPLIEEKLNSNFVSTLGDNSIYIKEDVAFLETLAEKEYTKHVQNNSVSISVLLDMPTSISRRIVYKMIENALCRKTDISSKYVDAVLSLIKNSTSGKSIDISKKCSAYIEYDILYIKEKTDVNTEFEYTLPLFQDVYIKEAGLHIAAVTADIDSGDCFTVPTGSIIKIRNRRSGDIFYPDGMTGRKKVKDYYTDKKIPLSLRDKVCIVTFNDEIGYIIGYRKDKRFDFKGEGIKIIYSSDPINI